MVKRKTPPAAATATGRPPTDFMQRLESVEWRLGMRPDPPEELAPLLDLAEPVGWWVDQVRSWPAEQRNEWCIPSVGKIGPNGLATWLLDRAEGECVYAVASGGIPHFEEPARYTARWARQEYEREMANG